MTTAPLAIVTRATDIFHKGGPIVTVPNVDLILHDELCESMLLRAWPGNLDPDRRRHKTSQLVGQSQIHIAESRACAELLRCTGPSVLDSLVACATLDLSLVKALGEAYLVPFKNVCTLMIGYKGFIKLIVNTGFVTHIESVLVYQGEMFKFWRDEKGPHWNHEPDITQQGDPEKVLACYAAGYTRDGKPMFEVMNIDELEHVRRTSKMADAAGPYQSWRTEMYRKAPIRRLQKWLPKTGDNLGFQILTKALEVDNQMFDLERTRKFDEGSQQFRLEQQERKDKDFDERMEAAEKAATPAVEPKPEPAKSESLASQIKLVAATWKAKINKDPLATEADFAAWVQVTASTDADMTMTKNWTPEIVSRCMDALKGTSNA